MTPSRPAVTVRVMDDKRRQRLEEFVSPFRVKPGSTVNLERDFDPAFKAGVKKKEGRALLAEGVQMLAEYQARLAAQDTWGVLVVRVHPENLDRQRLPHQALHGDVWRRRFREINDWERYLTDNGFRIVKLFLNLSKEEQRTRFLRRIDLPDHNWKFSTADIAERQRWDDYRLAFSEALSHTSTEWAPWYVIPADRKWFGRFGAAAVLVHTLMEIDPQFPTVTSEQRDELQKVKERLEAQAPTGSEPDPFAAIT